MALKLSLSHPFTCQDLRVFCSQYASSLFSQWHLHHIVFHLCRVRQTRPSRENMTLVALEQDWESCYENGLRPNDFSQKSVRFRDLGSAVKLLNIFLRKKDPVRGHLLYK